MRPVVLPALAVLLCCAAPLAAQQPSVEIVFKNGQVWLTARAAPVQTILTEWARLGAATVVNGDGLADTPVTLELAGVPESHAIDIVLRGAAGYALARRPAGSSGAAFFDRILILATTTVSDMPDPPQADDADSEDDWEDDDPLPSFPSMDDDAEPLPPFDDPFFDDPFDGYNDDDEGEDDERLDGIDVAPAPFSNPGLGESGRPVPGAR